MLVRTKNKVLRDFINLELDKINIKKYNNQIN